MKKAAFCFFLFLSVLQLNAQPADSSFVCNLPEETAEFPGGTQALQKYLASNIAYPAEARENGLSGKVYIKFVVNENGSLSNFQMLKGMRNCEDCNKEALRVLKEMPDWKPAKMSGKTVKCYITLPVKFAIQ